MMKSPIYNASQHTNTAVLKGNPQTEREQILKDQKNISKETFHYDNRGKTNSNHLKHILAQDGERALFTTRTTAKIRERQDI